MPNQIARLRKKGFLDEALQRSLELMEKESEDIRVRRAYAWVLYDLTKKALRENDKAEALRNFEIYENLELTPEDVMLHENFARLRPKAKPDSQSLVEALEAKITGNHQEALDKMRAAWKEASDPQYLSEEYAWALFRVLKEKITESKEAMADIAPLMQEYRSVFKSRPALVHSQMLRLMLKIADVPLPLPEGGYLDMLEFFDWWNLDNLRSDDFKPFTTEIKGKEKIIQPMAATAYGSYSSLLIDRYEYALRKNDDAEAEALKVRMEAFLEKLTEFYRVHPNYEWMPYYKLKLKIALHITDEKTEQSLLDFVKKQRKDFWAWGTMGDYYLGIDPEIAIGCYCKALTCKAPNEFLGRTRLKLARLLPMKNLYNEAKTELMTIITTYEMRGWKIPRDVTEMMGESWYEKARVYPLNANLYRDWKWKAEELIFGKQTIYTCIITRIDRERGNAFFIINKEITGKVVIKEFPGMAIESGMIFDVTLEKKFGPNKVVSYKAARLMPSTKTLSDEIAKPFYGQLKVNAKAGFGFVDTIYIHPDLIKMKNLRHYQQVNGMAVIQFDPKKQQWGWSAVSLSGS